MDKTRDVFTRIRAYDSASLQYTAAVEELVRANFGKVDRTHFRLKPNNGECHRDDVAALLSSLSCVGADTALVNDSGRDYYLLGQEWAASISVTSKLEGSAVAEEGAVAEQGVSEAPTEQGAVSHIEQLQVDLNLANPSIFDTISKCCVDAGFVILAGFEVDKGVPIVFAFPGKDGPEYATQSMDSQRLSTIEENYTPNVITDTKTFLDYASKIAHGLLLVSGPVGTGKSYLIRSIVSELTERRTVVCTPPIEFLERSGMLARVVANFRKCIVVLEDVGEVIAFDSASKFVDARTNLLNLTEGFLSLLTDCIVVISFNYDIDKIDPAILRPGRCLGNVTVGKLPYEQACSLVPCGLADAESYSLAEVYEARRLGRGDVCSERLPVGFKK